MKIQTSRYWQIGFKGYGKFKVVAFTMQEAIDIAAQYIQGDQESGPLDLPKLIQEEAKYLGDIHLASSEQPVFDGLKGFVAVGEPLLVHFIRNLPRLDRQSLRLIRQFRNLLGFAKKQVV
jgi:hypothetical protein